MRSKKADIAVVGMACQFPGARDYNQFWNNLEAGVCSIKEITPDRWDVEAYYAADINEPGKSVSKWCGLLDQVYDFDHQFFKISPREVLSMDPQQRLLLEETWRCIEDSGISLSMLQNKRTSVYAGVMTTDYRQEMMDARRGIDSYACLGNFEGMLANRISYTFQFQGASQSINAACASSLVAVHEAKQALRLGECDYALIACVNLNLHPWKYISFSKSRMLSPDGICRTFDIDANGYVPGDGVGVLLLQRLNDAVKDRNQIYGKIKGTAVNHSGKSDSITAPRVEGQLDVIISAYKDAGLHPESVNYVEAHGTGTSLGDPIELAALTGAFRKYTEKNQYCKIGSVKTNIGHLESAAGVAGIMKVLMMMKHRKIPQTLHLKTLNPIISWDNIPFIPSERPSSWEPVEDRYPLRAGVSSFGFGGVNSHILLEEYQEARVEGPTSTGSEFFILSAKNEKSQKHLQEAWRAFTDTPAYEDYRLSDISGTLLTGRVAFAYRCGILVESKEELKEKLLSGHLDWAKTTKRSWELHIQDLSWTGYSEIKHIYLECELFKQAVDEAIKILKSLRVSRRVWSGFFEEFWNGSERALYEFIAGYAYASTLLQLGFRPDMVTGSRNGWWVALVVSGILRLEDILALKIGKCDLKNIPVAIPVIPLRDRVSGKMHFPLQCDAAYIEDLIDYGHSNGQATQGMDPSEHSVHYYLLHLIEKARLLYPVQQTFKKYIDDWNTIIQKEVGYNIIGRLYDKQLCADEENVGQIDNILLLVLANSLRKLNRKWNLQEQLCTCDSRIEELMNLVDDGIISGTSIVQLLAHDKLDTADAAEIINRNLEKKYSDREYPLMLKYYLQNIVVTITSEWIIQSEHTEYEPIRDEDTDVIQVGIGNRAVQFEIHIGAVGDTFKHFQENILELWQKGTVIRWESLLRSKHFHKRSLPLYPFDREYFHINEQKNPRATSPEPELGDQELRQMLNRLESGELEITDITKRMGDEW